MEEILQLVEKGTCKGYIVLKGKIDEQNIDLVFLTLTKGIYRNVDKASANIIKVQIPLGNIFYSMEIKDVVSNLVKLGELDDTTKLCVDLKSLSTIENIDDIYYGVDSISVHQGRMELDDDKTVAMQLKRNLREVIFHL